MEGPIKSFKFYIQDPIIVLLIVCSVFAIDVQAATSPLKFKVTVAGTHDVDWTYHFRENTSPGGGWTSDLSQEGSEFINYDSNKSVTMTFKTKPGVGLVGTVDGKGIEKYPRLKVDITNSNFTDYTCSGNCPPPPDRTPLSSGCGRSFDTANIKLTYEAGTFTVESLRVSDVGSVTSGTVIPPGFDPRNYYLPIGVLYPVNCGPSYPPNDPLQDLVDFRYPFLVISNSNLLPGKNSKAVDNKIKSIKVGKTLSVKLEMDITPTKTYLIDGSGYTYSGQTSVFWLLKLKRIS